MRRSFFVLTLIMLMLFTAACGKKEEGPSEEALEQLEKGRSIFYGTARGGYDKEAAAECFKAAAEGGAADGYWYLGMIAERTDESGRYRKAMEYYDKAIENGSLYGLLGKGRLCIMGAGTDRDFDKAVSLYKEALDGGLTEANLYLAQAYHYGLWADNDPALAAEYYEKALASEEFGCRNEARIGLGLLHHDGTALPQDDAKAMEYYQAAADDGYSGGNYRLGTVYEFGYGAEQNYPKALEYYKTAADFGNSSAMVEIGILTHEGNGTDRNDEIALEWFEKAAEEGDPEGMDNIGFMYENGFAVTKDPSKAMEWYMNASESGQGRALNNIAVLYCSGVDGAADYKKRLEYFEKAGETGLNWALANAAYIYITGAGGVEPDYAKALELYKKAYALPDMPPELNAHIQQVLDYAVSKGFITKEQAGSVK